MLKIIHISHINIRFNNKTKHKCRSIRSYSNINQYEIQINKIGIQTDHRIRPNLKLANRVARSKFQNSAPQSQNSAFFCSGKEKEGGGGKGKEKERGERKGKVKERGGRRRREKRGRGR